MLRHCLGCPILVGHELGCCAQSWELGTKSRPFIQSLHSCELPQVFTQQHTRDAGSEVPPFAQLDVRKQHVQACRVLGRLHASRGVGVDEDNPGHQFGSSPPMGAAGDICRQLQ